MTTLARAVPPLFAFTLLLASAVAAQESVAPGQLAGQSLRPYWMVFAAYAIAIVLVMGWAVSIAKRLSDLEDRLAE